ncbi:MAG: aminotransferase class V-fold PLP-dependent enzyme [Acidobacteriota bacterium]
MDDRKFPRRTFLRGAVVAPILAQLASVRRVVAEQVAAEVGALPEAPLPWRLRSLYSLEPSVTYLNHASIGTIPRPVQAAHRRYLEICETNPWLYMWGGDWDEPREAVRQRAAQLLSCQVEEIAFTHNTTEAFNLLAQGLPLGPGDEVLFSSLNHTGASACWDHMAEVRGFTVRRFDFPLHEVPDLDRQAVIRIYSEQVRPETKVLVFPHVDNMVGLRHPVKELAAAARAVGVRYVAVDAAQTVGMIPTDVGGMGVDVYAASPHKWLQSPKGLGLAYISRSIQADLRPMWVTWGQDDFAGSARIYEDYGTRNLPEVLALGDAIDFQQSLGAAAKAAHHRELREHARSAVAAEPRLVWRSPNAAELSAALYSIEHREQSSRDLFERLFRRHGFVFRPFASPGFDAVRLSPNVANSRDELDRFVAALLAA